MATKRHTKKEGQSTSMHISVTVSFGYKHYAAFKYNQRKQKQHSTSQDVSGTVVVVGGEVRLKRKDQVKGVTTDACERNWDC